MLNQPLPSYRNYEPEIVTLHCIFHFFLYGPFKHFFYHVVIEMYLFDLFNYLLNK